MSHPAYLAPRLETTELICILKVVRSAVFVVNFPGYSTRFTPTVIRTLIGSLLCGLMSTKMRDYVNVHITGILLSTKKENCLYLFSPFLEICLQVFYSILTIHSSRGLLFIFLLIALYLFTVGCTLCLDQ